MEKVVEKIIPIYTFRIKKNRLNSDRMVRDKLSQELMKSYTTLKKVYDLAYDDGRREVVEHIRDTLNTLYLINPTSLLYLVWLVGSGISTFLIFEYSKFKAVRGV